MLSLLILFPLARSLNVLPAFALPTGLLVKQKTRATMARGAGSVKLARTQARSKRSAFMTLVQAATKSRTNFSLLSSWAYTSA